MTRPRPRAGRTPDARVAIVTGGAGDIGQATAAALARAGVCVVLADVIPPEDWPAGTRNLEVAEGAGISPDVVDVTSVESCEDLVARVQSVHRRLDVIVNNAGVNIRKTLVETSESEWLRVQNVNVNGAYRLCRAAHGALRDGDHPAVVNIASTAGVVGIPGTAAYGVSKAALIQLTRVLASEWAADGIRVNAVAPTIVPTAMTSDIMSDKKALEAKLATIPLGRVVEAEEVGEAVAYLASPAARSISGHTLLLDGGFTVT